MHGPRSRTTAWILVRLLAVALAAWCVSTSNAAAQGLSGTVVDSTHAGIPQATVTVEDLDRQVTRRVVTDGQGRFAAADLAVGAYVVEAVASGGEAFDVLAANQYDVVISDDADFIFIQKEGEPAAAGIPVPPGTDLRKASHRYVVRDAKWSLIQ